MNAPMNAPMNAGPSRIRILQVITSLAGGAGLQVCQLAQHLDARRFDVRLAFGPGYPLDALVVARGIAHHELPWTRRLAPLALARGTLRLAQLLGRERFDIVHTHCSIAGALGRPLAYWQRGAARRPRVLFTVHAFASRPWQPAWRQRAALAVERALDRCTDHYCVSTHAVRAALCAKGIAPPGRVSVIPLGIEHGPADPARLADPHARARARCDLGLAPDAFAIGAAGRLEEQKGFAHLIRALPMIRQAVPQAVLVIVGAGPLANALARAARSAGVAHATHFTGWRDDLPALLPGFDLFCLPSLWETFGYVLPEAMAAGVPVVASEVEGIPEVLGHGRLGVLVPPANSAALARAIVALAHDAPRRTRLAEAARRHALDEYSLQTMIGRYEVLYQKIHEQFQFEAE